MNMRPVKFMLILVLSLPLKAEDNNAAMQSFIQQQQQTIQNMQNKINQNQGQDRADKSEKASAAAIMGAAMAGMSCMMLMKKAMEEEDPELKQMYMMMAMQQCQQAAQDKDSGKKNNDSKNQLTQNDVPQVPDFSSKEQPKEEPLPQFPTVSTETPTERKEIEFPEIPQYEVAKKDETLGSTVDEGVGQETISRMGNTVDEKNRGIASTASPAVAGGVGSIFGFSGAAGSKDEALKKAALENAAPLNQKRGVRTEGGGEAGSGGGDSGSSGGSGKGNDGFDSMFNQMLAGGASPEQGTLQGPGSDIVGFSGVSEKNTPNIFEYASFRYKNLAYQEGKVIPKKTKLALSK